MSPPIRVAARLSGHRGRVFLHSASDDDGCGRFSFVACDPVRIIEARGREIVLFDRDGTASQYVTGDPLGALQELVEHHGRGWTDISGEGPVPVAIGYLGYELATLLDRRGAEPEEPEMVPQGQLPDLWFGLYDAVWRFDHATGRSDICGRHVRARRALAEAIARGEETLGPPPLLRELMPAHTSAEYRHNLERILQYIRAGDVYQVNLARCLGAEVVRAGDPLTIYKALVAAAPAPFGALLSIDRDTHVISGSPECFLAREAGSAVLETRPIRGTRRRTGDPEHDRKAAEELASNEKERAEHLMIVDLERSDLGRIAEVGSVDVTKLGYVLELPHLYHLVSRVSCRLRANVTVPEIIRATFPGGSITGAPKVRAMELIEEVEGMRRGPYTGAIGYIGVGDSIGLSTAIRTAVIDPRRLTLHVGGGIVADSTPEREFEETEEKAAGWRAALASIGH